MRYAVFMEFFKLVEEGGGRGHFYEQKTMHFVLNFYMQKTMHFALSFYIQNVLILLLLVYNLILVYSLIVASRRYVEKLEPVAQSYVFKSRTVLALK